MARRVVVLENVKEEFRDIKNHVKQEFGEQVWNTVNGEFRKAVGQIKENPVLAQPLEELKELGILNARCMRVRQTRIVYTFDDDLVVIHMFIHPRRDFRTHLFKRLLSQ